MSGGAPPCLLHRVSGGAPPCRLHRVWWSTSISSPPCLVEHLYSFSTVSGGTPLCLLHRVWWSTCMPSPPCLVEHLHASTVGVALHISLAPSNQYPRKPPSTPRLCPSCAPLFPLIFPQTTICCTLDYKPWGGLLAQAQEVCCPWLFVKGGEVFWFLVLATDSKFFVFLAHATGSKTFFVLGIR